MPYKHKRDCPVCDKPGLRYMSSHLRQVHHLYGDERKTWLGRARFSISHKHCSGSLPGCPTHTIKEMRCVRKKTCSVWQPPTKAGRKITASMVTKPCPEFNFRHKFLLLVVGPTQSGKTYFVQKNLENNRIVYEEQKSICIFWYYNQWQECYEKLKKSLGKSIRFERGVPELSEDLCEINARYNNIIILDDLMAEATDSPVVSRLFTQGRHRNASAILLLQNMFPKGNIIQISAEMPSTWLSFEVLAIGNKSELLENACLTRIECTLWTHITKRPKNRMDTCWWITSPAHQPIIRFLQTYLGNAMLITSVWTVLSLHVWKSSL